MARFNFTGGSYTSQAVGFDAQRSVNLYPELDEAGDSKSKMALYSTPGIRWITALEGIPRAQFEYNGRYFAVGGTKLYEGIATNDIYGNFISLSLNILNLTVPIVNDNLPASIAANETQLAIASGGFVYIYYLSSTVDSVTGLTVPAGTFKQVPASSFTLSTGNAPVIQVAFCDSFFLALIANSQTVCISNVLDGFNWTLNGQIVVNVYPENVVGMIVDHREVWLRGKKKTVVYFASGSLSVFDVSPGGFVEQGGASPFGCSLLDNSIFWVGGDDRGNAIGWRATGYNAQRITTHAVEFAWQSYPKISDAVSYAYQGQGHAFWVVFFPSANNFLGATWVYDTSTGLWHERDFLNVITGSSMAHPSWNHVFAFGQHIVGDWNSPNLYRMNINYTDNDGVPIIRMRTAPHVSTQMERMVYSQFELDMDVGLPAAPLVSVPFLQDSAGGLWRLWVSDLGILNTTKSSLRIGASIVLTDPTNAATWIVGVNTLGQLTTTSATLDLTGPKSLTLVGPSTFWNLQVTAGGLLQTIQTTQGSIVGSTVAPQIFLDWSNDGAKTWSNKQGRSFGLTGQTRTRVVWRRLGQARVRTYRVTCSEGVPIRIFDAYINAAPGYQPTERIGQQLRKSA